MTTNFKAISRKYITSDVIKTNSLLASVCLGPFPFKFKSGSSTSTYFKDKSIWMITPHNEQVSILYNKECIRIGSFDDALLLQGYGFVIYHDSKIIKQGNFKDDKLYGEGFIKTPSSSSFSSSIIYQYSDFWKNDVVIGHTKIVYANKDIYTGDYYDNQPHGKGTLHIHDQLTYIGHFSQGDATGYGTIKYINGDVYVGHCLKGVPHGFGFMMYNNPNQDSFRGHWIHGLSQRLPYSPIMSPKTGFLNLHTLPQASIQNAIDKLLI